MKKLIAISVILVLFTAAAFAETTFGATVYVTATLLQGTTLDAYPQATLGQLLDQTDANSDGYPDVLFAVPSGKNYKGVFTGLDFKRLRIQADTTNDEGNFGGRIRFDGSSFDLEEASKGSAADPGKVFSNGLSGFVWWKPIDLLKVQLGKNTDGDFDVATITGWGFYNDANDWGISQSAFDDAHGFNALFGGWGEAGLVLVVSPIEALAINIGIPLSGVKAGGDWSNLAKYVYLSSMAQVTFNIEGIGKVALTYQGGIGDTDWEAGETGKSLKFNPVTFEVTDPAVSPIAEKKEIADPAKLYLSFDLTAIENLGAQLGVAYKFGYVTEGNGTWTNIGVDPSNPVDLVTPDTSKANDWTQNGELSIGLGATYDMGAFGLKARVQANLLGGGDNEYTVGTTTTTVEHNAPFAIGVDLLPYFALSDSFKVYLGLGLGFTGADERTSKAGATTTTTTLNSTVDWNVNPYLTYSVGPATFYAGFKLKGTGERSGEQTVTGSPITQKGVIAKSYIDWSVPIGFALSF